MCHGSRRCGDQENSHKHINHHPNRRSGSPLPPKTPIRKPVRAHSKESLWLFGGLGGSGKRRSKAQLLLTLAPAPAWTLLQGPEGRECEPRSCHRGRREPGCLRAPDIRRTHPAPTPPPLASSPRLPARRRPPLGARPPMQPLPQQRWTDRTPPATYPPGPAQHSPGSSWYSEVSLAFLPMPESNQDAEAGLRAPGQSDQTHSTSRRTQLVPAVRRGETAVGAKLPGVFRAGRREGRGLGWRGRRQGWNLGQGRGGSGESSLLKKGKVSCEKVLSSFSPSFQKFCGVSARSGLGAGRWLHNHE